MEHKINIISQSEKEVEIILPYNEIKPDIDQEVKKELNKLQIPGFRKGKAPLSMVKKMYGDSLEYQAAEKVANNWFWKVSKENEIKFIGQPALTDLHFHPNEELHFKVKVEVLPELTPQNYTGNSIDIPDLQAKDSDVEHELKHLLNHHRKLEPHNAVENRDFIIKAELIRVNEDDSPFEGAITETIDIDLSNETIHSSIIEDTQNKQVEDSFTFTFTHPEQVDNDEQKQETFIYKGIIKEITKIGYPELNDEFIKTATKDKVRSLTEYKDKTFKDIQNYYDQRLKQMTIDLLINTIIKNNDFTPPESMVNNVLQNLVKHEEEKAKKEPHLPFDKNETKNRLKNQAIFQVKWFLLRNAIAKIENITITDDDIKLRAQADAESIGIDVEKLFEYYKASGLDDSLLEEKIFDYLRNNNNISKVDPEKLSKKESNE